MKAVRQYLALSALLLAAIPIGAQSTKVNAAAKLMPEGRRKVERREVARPRLWIGNTGGQGVQWQFPDIRGKCARTTALPGSAVQ